MTFRWLLAATALASASGATAQAIKPLTPTIAPLKDPAPTEVSREAPVNGVLTLYGNQRCPTDRSGNEVVVCVRRSAAEQFRIPKDLRNFKVTPQNEAWAKRLQPTLTAGAAGIGSCTTVGPGGGIGCFNQQAKIARADNTERKKDETPDLQP